MTETGDERPPRRRPSPACTTPPSPRGAHWCYAGSSATGLPWSSVVLLVVLFVGCFALPPLLPSSYTDLDYYALQQPPSARHWFGTNALGQDLLAQTLRGMQKSMLIGVCVAVISTIIAAAVGSVAGYFGGWRDRALMWVVDLLLVVPSFFLIVIVHPARRQSASIVGLIVVLARVQLDDQLAPGARYDDEPARARIRPGGKVYGCGQLAHHRAAHRCRTWRRS